MDEDEPTPPSEQGALTIPASADASATSQALELGTVAAAGPAVPAPNAEEEEEELDDDVVAKAAQTMNREETKALLDTFDEETLTRYEVFRRAHLPKAIMRKVVGNLVGPVPASVAIGIALYFYF